MASFTHRQGQFLAFIHPYRLPHRRSPAEADLVAYFRISPPSVHQMLGRLEELGLLTREPGVPRSARVVVPVEEIPASEPVEGPSW
ncbi:MAG: MarR family transcriptional regulator [Gemmataceae bacterium]|nr:MarR family transcriptional regulator [Gemmataceae bacterium]